MKDSIGERVYNYALNVRSGKPLPEPQSQLIDCLVAAVTDTIPHDYLSIVPIEHIVAAELFGQAMYWHFSNNSRTFDEASLLVGDLLLATGADILATLRMPHIETLFSNMLMENTGRVDKIQSKLEQCVVESTRYILDHFAPPVSLSSANILSDAQKYRESLSAILLGSKYSSNSMPIWLTMKTSKEISLNGKSDVRFYDLTQAVIDTIQESNMEKGIVEVLTPPGSQLELMALKGGETHYLDHYDELFAHGVSAAYIAIENKILALPKRTYLALFAPNTTSAEVKITLYDITQRNDNLEMLLAQFEKLLRLQLLQDPERIRSSMSSFLESGGKRLRAKLALLCAQSGHVFLVEKAHLLAAAVELIHNSTLIHDDLVDHSNKRRGQPTVHSLVGERTATEIGDYYFFKAGHILAKIGHPDVTAAIMQAVPAVCNAQIQELEMRGQYPIDEQTYLDIVKGKTAMLFAAACKAGAVLSQASSQTIHALYKFGEFLGIAFQVIDDIMDFSKNSGKPLGIDLREKVMSLPIIYAAKDPRLRKRIQNATSQDYEDVANLVRESGALEAACRQAYHWLDLAEQELGKTNNLEVSEHLMSFITWSRHTCVEALE